MRESQVGEGRKGGEKGVERVEEGEKEKGREDCLFIRALALSD